MTFIEKGIAGMVWLQLVLFIVAIIAVIFLIIKRVNDKKKENFENREY